MNLMQTAKAQPFLSTVAATAVSITAILAGAKALDIRLIPWATASEIEELNDKIETRDEQILKIINSLATSLRKMDTAQSALLREFWEKRFEEAEEELRLNPSSRTAKAQRLEAKRNIESIDLNAAGVPLRDQAPQE